MVDPSETSGKASITARQHWLAATMTPIMALVASVYSAITLITCGSPQVRVAYCVALAASMCLLLGSFRPAKVVVVLSLPFVLPLFAIHGFLNAMYPIDNVLFGIIPYRTNGLMFAATIGSSMILVITGATAWLMVRKDDIIEALFRSRLPFWITMIGSQGLAMADHVSRRVDRVYLAQRARGVPMGNSVWARVRAFPTIIIPVAVSVLIESDYRGIALASRGFASASPIPVEKNTSIGRPDVKAAFLFSTCFCGALAFEYWL
jgi:energy-coupling factor transporter transmembrane protein EcfT